MPLKSCYEVWLRKREELSSFLPDIQDTGVELEFLELLADSTHWYLFKVRVKDTDYALKLYTIYKPHWPRFEQSALQQDLFIVECRVYSRLFENKLGVGPRCHGWLTLIKKQESELDRKFYLSSRYSHNEREWSGFRQDPEKQLDPVRGLLLEYIDGTTLGKARLSCTGARSLRTQLTHLHFLGIAHGDFYPRNIMVSKGRNGRARLIDFSSAKIWPRRGCLNNDDFDKYLECEKCDLESFFLQLQEASIEAWYIPILSNADFVNIKQLRLHQGIKFTEIRNEKRHTVVNYLYISVGQPRNSSTEEFQMIKSSCDLVSIPTTPFSPHTVC